MPERFPKPAPEGPFLRATLRRMDEVLAFRREAIPIPEEVRALLEQREKARAGKNWAESDRLRAAIAQLGWNVKDTKDGSQLTPQ